MQVWHLPDYWYWLVPLLFFFAATFCAVKWHKYLLGVAAILFLVMFVCVSVLWVITWSTQCDVGLMWIKYPPNGRVEQWHSIWTSSRGGMRLDLSGQSFSATSNNAKKYGPRSLVWDTGDNQGRYPTWGNKASLTQSDFIQKTLGFQICWSSALISSSVGLYSVTVPHWFAMLLCLPVPALWMRRFLKQRSRRIRGLCQKCGYDLRGSTEKCPECGTPVPSPKITLVKHAT